MLCVLMVEGVSSHCGRPWSVCKVVSVSYGGAMTGMRVLLFVCVTCGNGEIV